MTAEQHHLLVSFVVGRVGPLDDLCRQFRESAHNHIEGAPSVSFAHIRERFRETFTRTGSTRDPGAWQINPFVEQGMHVLERAYCVALPHPFQVQRYLLVG